jgi:hypothetical protein
VWPNITQLPQAQFSVSLSDGRVLDSGELKMNSLGRQYFVTAAAAFNEGENRVTLKGTYHGHDLPPIGLDFNVSHSHPPTPIHIDPSRLETRPDVVVARLYDQTPQGVVY